MMWVAYFLNKCEKINVKLTLKQGFIKRLVNQAYMYNCCFKHTWLWYMTRGMHIYVKIGKIFRGFVRKPLVSLDCNCDNVTTMLFL